ncbi:exopolysaccharide biosynthesis WecB/TagA/CpsF family protein [Haloferula luteola]|uniref:Exopolysaccharide biosynthesis WecB/TagA/CpsF family protein n=1 Tax=Haloferula luteola TaxID=595692 RepID=A0A840UYT2_9BACT|nr:WecB/TagA/CpsF family glycosyltransferase [Haloferula luteola]MBB5350895.1 exopolysaccharide biosynthesis WecB/TagA/CpsF family protein [Haloferula luteola]
MMGVPFDQLNTAQALEVAEEMIQSRRPHLLATANVDFLAQVQEDEDLQQILVDADLIFCDGTPLVWMSKWLGDPLPERLAGSDMVPLLLDLAQEKGHRVFFLGGRDEVVAVAEEKLLERWPRLQIAGMYSPPFAPLEKMDHDGICRKIQEARADLLFVSFGCPKQEKWLSMNYRRAGVPVTMGVGATIDFIAGAVKRAPVWMRKAGLEWFYRVLQEPRRLAGRYWRDIRVVMPGLTRQWIRMRSGSEKAGALLVPSAPREESPAAAAAPLAPIVEGVSEVPVKTDEVSAMASAPTESATSVPPVVVEGKARVVRLPERLDALAARDASLWPEGELASLVLDASRTTFLDSTGTGKLVRFARTAREKGGKCILAEANESMLGTLQLMRLRSLFVEAPSVKEALAMVEGS